MLDLDKSALRNWVHTATNKQSKPVSDLSLSKRELIHTVFRESLEQTCPQNDRLNFQYLPVLESKFRQTLTKICKIENLQTHESTDNERAVLDHAQKIFHGLVVEVFSNISKTDPLSVKELQTEALTFSSWDLSIRLHEIKMVQALHEYHKLLKQGIDPEKLALYETWCNAILQAYKDLCEIKKQPLEEVVFKISDGSQIRVFNLQIHHKELTGNIYAQVPEGGEILLYKIPKLGSGKFEWVLDKSWFLIRKESGQFTKFTKEFSLTQSDSQFKLQELLTKILQKRNFYEEVQEIDLSDDPNHFDCNLRILDLALERSNHTFGVIPKNLPVSIETILQMLKKIKREKMELSQQESSSSNSINNPSISILNDFIIQIVLNFLTLPRGCEFITLYLQDSTNTLGDVLQNHSFTQEYSTLLQDLTNELLR